ncbi:MAG: hypothetical protein QW728_02575 [Thermoplasmata archaeon]
MDVFANRVKVIAILMDRPELTDKKMGKDTTDEKPLSIYKASIEDNALIVVLSSSSYNGRMIIEADLPQFFERFEPAVHTLLPENRLNLTFRMNKVPPDIAELVVWGVVIDGKEVSAELRDYEKNPEAEEKYPELLKRIEILKTTHRLKELYELDEKTVSLTDSRKSKDEHKEKTSYRVDRGDIHNKGLLSTTAAEGTPAGEGTAHAFGTVEKGNVVSDYRPAVRIDSVELEKKEVFAGERVKGVLTVASLKERVKGTLRIALIQHGVSTQVYSEKCSFIGVNKLDFAFVVPEMEAENLIKNKKKITEPEKEELKEWPATLAVYLDLKGESTEQIFKDILLVRKEKEVCSISYSDQEALLECFRPYTYRCPAEVVVRLNNDFFKKRDYNIAARILLNKRELLADTISLSVEPFSSAEKAISLHGIVEQLANTATGTALKSHEVKDLALEIEVRSEKKRVGYSSYAPLLKKEHSFRLFLQADEYVVRHDRDLVIKCRIGKEGSYEVGDGIEGSKADFEGILRLSVKAGDEVVASAEGKITAASPSLSVTVPSAKVTGRTDDMGKNISDLELRAELETVKPFQFKQRWLVSDIFYIPQKVGFEFVKTSSLNYLGKTGGQADTIEDNAKEYLLKNYLFEGEELITASYEKDDADNTTGISKKNRIKKKGIESLLTSLGLTYILKDGKPAGFEEMLIHADDVICERVKQPFLNDLRIFQSGVFYNLIELMHNVDSYSSSQYSGISTFRDAKCVVNYLKALHTDGNDDLNKTKKEKASLKETAVLDAFRSAVEHYKLFAGEGYTEEDRLADTGGEWLIELSQPDTTRKAWRKMVDELNKAALEKDLGWLLNGISKLNRSEPWHFYVPLLSSATSSSSSGTAGRDLAAGAEELLMKFEGKLIRHLSGAKTLRQIISRKKSCKAG